ncbi:MAG: hypothetical protein IIC82_08050 [Chloroflexi bacterium]|nr:hypothetical protein [Chloroflexota bacterium]
MSRKGGDKNNKKKSKSSKALRKTGRPPKHGLSNTPTYESWRNAKQRCTNPNYTQYHDYGGRGIECRITVEELVQDIGLRPDGTTLDRIDPDGHYEPGNVRWATRKVQANNKRPPGYHSDKRKQEIRDAHREWVDNARCWRLSLKLVNTGTLNLHERDELTRVGRRTGVPRASFSFDAPRDEENLSNGWVELPSLVHRDQKVRVKGGPFGDMSDSPHLDAGVIAGLVDHICSNISPPAGSLFIRKFNAILAGQFSGLCYSYQAPGDTAWNIPSESPERALMAVTALLLEQGYSARMMPMAEVSEYLSPDDDDSDSWGPLLTEWLVIPDFHVSGPKGYGLEPWLVKDLRTLLKRRMDERWPTIIFAFDPWALDDQIGALINRHYAFITPREIQELNRANR